MAIKDVDKVVRRVLKSPTVKESIVLIENGKGEELYFYGYHRNRYTPILMCSITKLFVSTCIYQLIEEHKLSWTDTIGDLLKGYDLLGLNVTKHVDYSESITIDELMRQNSGLPNFFMAKRVGLMAKALVGDFSYTFDELLDWNRELDSTKVPGRGRSSYSDFNFDLLGKVIEVIDKKTLEEVFNERIYKPCGLHHTHLPKASDDVPEIYLARVPFERPKFISSLGACGGGVSNAQEILTFLRCFIQGSLFKRNILREAKSSDSLGPLMFPKRYARGFMVIPVNLPFKEKRTLIGHIGATGAFAFYVPEKDAYIVGDTPNVQLPQMIVQFVVRMALAL